jgi:hypothetical protein
MRQATASVLWNVAEPQREEDSDNTKHKERLIDTAIQFDTTVNVHLDTGNCNHTETLDSTYAVKHIALEH